MKFWMIVNIRQYSDDFSDFKEFGYELKEGTYTMYFDNKKAENDLFCIKKIYPDGDWILLESVGIVEENKGLMTIEDMDHYLG